MKRIVLAGLLGGVAMFIWSSIAHVATPLGQVGVSQIPNEQPVIDALHTALGSSNGFYIYPGMTPGTSMEDYDKKLAANSQGLLIYHPPGGKAFEPRMLVTEFLTELIEAFIVVLLIARSTAATFGGRMGVAVLIAIAGGITTNLSYWNWYGFPTAYTLCYMMVEMIGYLVAGAVASAMLGKRA